MPLTTVRQTNIRSPLAWLLELLIRMYRLVPKQQQHCIYHPTCSAYGLEAVREYGAIKGGCLALTRVCRCHPWGRGGLDPVPPRRQDRSTRDGSGNSPAFVFAEE